MVNHEKQLGGKGYKDHTTDSRDLPSEDEKHLSPDIHWSVPLRRLAIAAFCVLVLLIFLTPLKGEMITICILLTPKAKCFPL